MRFGRRGLTRVVVISLEDCFLIRFWRREAIEERSEGVREGILRFRI